VAAGALLFYFMAPVLGLPAALPVTTHRSTKIRFGPPDAALACTFRMGRHGGSGKHSGSHNCCDQQP